MTAHGISRERERRSPRGPQPGLDLRPVTGEWEAFAAPTSGIVHISSTEHDGRLLMHITEADGTDLRKWDAFHATPMADEVDSDAAVGFHGEAHLGVDLGSREAVVCGYLNRGVLAIDLYETRPQDQGAAARVVNRRFLHRPVGPSHP
ncbi:hypothetical protein [Streptomyces natalensis]|uniref:Uncharacterized protein n=1 Tax=Streptomyces natalensis ATCC 27448 TaxID=1240678 RepID=A0A0D7CII5_9ACTN|nr:hypothetical protein [Streptomyces natalensis]KIZ16018.1 hypothetical protein SNA_22540 [Streptomyces natalensis ATCC 27448]